MKCKRCKGLMVLTSVICEEELQELMRCINCGELTDKLVEQNRFCSEIIRENPKLSLEKLTRFINRKLLKQELQHF